MTFKINGFKILDTLKILKEKSSDILGEFRDSVQYYETQAGDIEYTPFEVISKYTEVQKSILNLQELQSAYNLYVRTDMDITLQGLIKLQGIFATIQSTWDLAPKASPYPQKDMPTVVRKVTQVEVKQASKLAAQEHKRITSLIRQVNSREVDLDVLKRKFGLKVTEEDFKELS